MLSQTEIHQELKRLRLADKFRLLGCLSQPHQFPDQPVAHFDAAYQHQQIENQLTDVVPHDGGRCKGVVCDDGRRRGKG